MLSLVQLCASTFRPSLPTQFTYSWFKGTCKALVKDVAGTVGVLVDDDWAGQARPLDKDSRARVKRAMRWLIGHNPFFAQYLCLAERLDGAVGVDRDSGLPLGQPFVTVRSTALNLVPIRQIGNNFVFSPHVRVGEDRSGLLVSVDNFSPLVQQPELRIGNIDAGSAVSRNAGRDRVSYSDRNIEMKTFVDLYPRGRAGYHPDLYRDEPRRTPAPAHYLKARLYSADERWRRSYFWSFFMFDWMEKLRIHGAQSAVVRESEATKSGARLTAGLARASHIWNRNALSSSADDDVQAQYLPPSVTGSCTYWRKRLLDLKALVAELGTPHLFVTLTAHEHGWSDLRPVLNGHAAIHCPVEVVRHFHWRFRQLLKRIHAGLVFGPVADTWFRLEYQHRGSPHIHMLVWLKRPPKDLCQLVCARIPTRPPHLTAEENAQFDQLVNLVRQHQVHEHSHKYCLTEPFKNGRCRDSFPAPRRDHCELVRDGQEWEYTRLTAEDQMVIPYNPQLLMLWGCRTHTVVCTDYGVERYLCKYLAKTEPLFEASVNVDPQTQAYLRSPAGKHIHGRIISSPEVSARLLGYAHAEGTRAVHFLDTNMPSQRTRSLRHRSELEALNPNSTDVFNDGQQEKYFARPQGPLFDNLTYPQYFRSVRIDLNLMAIMLYRLYDVLPPSAPLGSNRQFWLDARGRRVVARLQPAIYRWHFKRYDRDGEAFWFQQLLLNVPARSVEELCSPGADSYRHECFRRGVVKDYDQLRWMEQLAIERHFDPKAVAKMLQQLRTCDKGVDVESALPGGYGDEHLPAEGPEYAKEPLPVPCDCFDADQEDVQALLGLDTLKRASQLLYPSCRLVNQLTPSQKRAHFHVCNRVLAQKQQGLFWISGAGGTGKSDLVRTLVTTLQTAGQDVAVTATSGSAACLLNGQTVHAQLGLQMDLTYSRALQSTLAMRLRRLDTLIIDEVSMMPASWLDAVDRVLRQVRERNQPFGGVNVVLVGDFYQLPAVIDRDHVPTLTGGSDFGNMPSDAQVYDHPLFHQFQPLFLIENCRQAQDTAYAALLNRLRVGLLSPNDCAQLMHKVLPFDMALAHARETGSLVLATRNAVVDEVNDAFLHHVPTASVSLPAVDRYSPHSARFGDEPANSTDGVLRSQSGLKLLNKMSSAESELTLKVGAHVMLTRNLNMNLGLVNGMRGVVTAIEPNVITLRRVGPARDDKSELVYISRSTDHIKIRKPDGFVQVTRTQYPLRVCYAATVHKAQGATLDRAVVVLDHMTNSGQLYTALSRVKRFADLVLTWRDPSQSFYGLRPFVLPAVDKVMVDGQQRSSQLVDAPANYDGSQWLVAAVAATSAVAISAVAGAQNASSGNTSAARGHPPHVNQSASSDGKASSDQRPGKRARTEASSAPPSLAKQTSHSAGPADASAVFDPPSAAPPAWMASRSFPCQRWALEACGPDTLLELLYHGVFCRYPSLFDRPGCTALRQVLRCRRLQDVNNPDSAARVNFYKLLRVLHGRYSPFFLRGTDDADASGLPVLGEKVDIYEVSSLLWCICDADLTILQDNVFSTVNPSQLPVARRLDLVSRFGLSVIVRCSSGRCGSHGACGVAGCVVDCHHEHRTHSGLALSRVCHRYLDHAVGAPRVTELLSEAKQSAEYKTLPLDNGFYMPLGGLITLQAAIDAELNSPSDRRCLHDPPVVRCRQKMLTGLAEPFPDILMLNFGKFGADGRPFGSCAQVLDPKSLLSFRLRERQYNLAGIVYYLPHKHFVGEFVIRIDGLDEFYYYDGIQNGGRALQIGSSPGLRDPYTGANLRARAILMFYVGA
ncbi:MAG: AAA family ATPase [Acidobacteriaceae bacterium]